MITLKQLKWSNCFSYGVNNVINFKDNPITQLVGSNGNGKSSIPLILELVLFNKNSKGIKTAEILNRYITDKSYSISLQFNKDSDEYFIDTKRATGQTVKISKNGEDISAHTATASFKLIEEILGFDHATFCQLVYQSSAQSLEFLTATDTKRKKFLIDLLGLEKYTDAFEVFKISTAEVSKEVLKAESALAVVSGWVDKHSKIDLTEKLLIEALATPVDLIEERSVASESLKQIAATNKAITTNNTYKDILDAIDLSQLPTGVIEDYSSITKTKTELEKDLKDANAFINKVNSLPDSCPTCGHEIDNSKQIELLGTKNEIKLGATKEIAKLAEQILKIEEKNKILTDAETKRSRWEQYHALYDSKLSQEILNKNDLEDRIVALNNKISKIELEIAKVTKDNQTTVTHNSKVAVIAEQLVSMNEDLIQHKAIITALQAKLTNLQILQKAFSTNGLLAFKIESMVKDLEELVNEYLAELSYGRFQLSFVISGEKLNVVITDNGKDIDIVALSSGEKARVNTATLLAIRKLMQQLSNTRINLLVLDETIDNLDIEGKEKLVELLVREEHLNTVLISHGYSHPLLEKIHVIKENNISRIE